MMMMLVRLHGSLLTNGTQKCHRMKLYLTYFARILERNATQLAHFGWHRIVWYLLFIWSTYDQDLIFNAKLPGLGEHELEHGC